MNRPLMGQSRNTSQRPTALLLLALAGAAGVMAIVTTYFVEREWENARLRGILEEMRNNPGAPTNQQVLDRSAEVASSIVSPETLVPERTRGDAMVADPEWSLLPRTNFTLATTIEDPSLLQGRDLFRNRHLNPTDCVIDVHRRKLFDTWLQQAREKLRSVKENIHPIAVQELDYLILRGRAPSIAYADYVRGLSDSERAVVSSEITAARERLISEGVSADEADKSVSTLRVYPRDPFPGAFVRAGRDDMLYAVNLASLPQTRQAAELYVAAVMQVYGDLHEFFSAHAGLSAQAIVESMNAIDRKLGQYR